MNKFILGRKIGMTQVFDAKGRVTPVTLIEAGPCAVTLIRAKEKDDIAPCRSALSVKTN